MSPEERAKALFPLVFGETLTPYQTAFRERIATAIREAEDAKLEQAARAVEVAAGVDPDSSYYRGGTQNYAVRQAADTIRSLKSQEP